MGANDVSVIIHRSFLLGRTAGEAVTAEQRDTLERLAEHDRLAASVALARGAHSARRDFEKMRSLLYAGGLHRVRLRGGRGIDG